MTIEETINGLQDMIQSKRYIEHNFDGVVDEDVCERAIALLKEQEEQIKNRDESLEKAREEIKWLRGMLKEQEPVQVVWKFAFPHCPECGQMLPEGDRVKYCLHCGQAVKWK